VRARVACAGGGGTAPGGASGLPQETAAGALDSSAVPATHQLDQWEPAPSCLHAAAGVDGMQAEFTTDSSIGIELAQNRLWGCRGMQVAVQALGAGTLISGPSPERLQSGGRCSRSRTRCCSPWVDIDGVDAGQRHRWLKGHGCPGVGAAPACRPRVGVGVGWGSLPNATHSAWPRAPGCGSMPAQRRRRAAQRQVKAGGLGRGS
jgi:hypothetical protein